MKTRLISTLLILIFVNSKTTAQILTESDIIGNWKVMSVHYLADKIPKNEVGMVEKQKKLFLKAAFNFKENHNCSFDIGVKEMKITNGYWTLNKKNGTISITENVKSKALLMEIQTKSNGNQVKFLITETLMGLEMKKE